MHHRNFMEIHQLSFTNYTKLTKDLLLKILKMRNDPNIRMKMTEQHEISEEEHLKFCASLKERKDCLYLLISYDHIPCGTVTIKKIDLKKQSAELGIYVIKEFAHYSQDFSLALEIIYKKLNILHCYCYVRKENMQALLYNLLKLKAEIIGEDTENIKLKFKDLPWGGPDKELEEKLKQLNELKKKYIINFEI